MNESHLSSQDSKSNPSSGLLEDNPQLLSAMLAALSEYPEAEGLSQDQLIAICEQAVQEGTINNRDWLVSRLTAVQAAGSSDPATKSDSSPEAKAEKTRPTFKEIVLSQACQPASQEEFEEIVSRHEQWIEAVLHPNKEVSGGRANFTGADLRNFDLSGVDLRGAIMNEVNLEGCSLRKANLATALLRGANLQNACFEEARLRRADLSDSIVAGADFHKADLRRLIDNGVDWSEAKNLEDALR